MARYSKGEVDVLNLASQELTTTSSKLQPLLRFSPNSGRSLININPFTAPACKTSGLKDAWTRLDTVYFPCPVAHLLHSSGAV